MVVNINMSGYFVCHWINYCNTFGVNICYISFCFTDKMHIARRCQSCDFAHNLKSVGIDSIYLTTVVDNYIAYAVHDYHRLCHITERYVIDVIEHVVHNAVGFKIKV